VRGGGKFSPRRAERCGSRGRGKREGEKGERAPEEEQLTDTTQNVTISSEGKGGGVRKGLRKGTRRDRNQVSGGASEMRKEKEDRPNVKKKIVKGGWWKHHLLSN